ncbi:MAG: TonB family protein, partial [Opitutus sp.]
MDARFLLPVSIATALHALVLFGVTWRHPSVPVGCSLPVIILDPFTWEKEPPEPIETNTDLAAAPKGAPEIFRPEQEEPAPIPSLFEQAPVRRPPSPVHVVDKISAEPVGVLENAAVEKTGIVVVSLDVLDNPPRTRSQVSPNYPATERNAGITGDVMVEFVVDEMGRVQRAHAVGSSHSAFESPAVRAVEKWRFEPGKRN